MNFRNEGGESMNRQVKWIAFLLIGFLIGFGGSFVFKGGSGTSGTEVSKPAQNAVVQTENETGNEMGGNTQATATMGKPEDIFTAKGCVQCHSVEGYGISGGQVGPDLSKAYEDTNNRFGKSLEDFLNNPEGTMSAVLKQNPLNDDEKKQIVEALKALADKKN